MSDEVIEAGDFVVTGPDHSMARKLQKHSGMWKDGQEEVSRQPGMVVRACRVWSCSNVCVKFIIRSDLYEVQILILYVKLQEQMCPFNVRHCR